MIERSDRVYLKAGMVRCQPQSSCADQASCARRCATIPQGSPLEDYSFNRTQGDPCRWFVPITRIPAAEPVQHNVKPWPGGEA
jgi:hypothetical protein